LEDFVRKSNYKAALYYAEKLRWPVFPVWPIRDGKCGCERDDCLVPGKHPVAGVAGEAIAPRGVLDASDAPAVVAGWWARLPDANIGARGLPWFVLDVDDMDALYELRENYGALPDTPTSFTGSGGMHIFFKQPEVRLGNREGKLPYGINVRGENGYVILPPSNHINGDYEWEVSSRPTEVELADPPDWLVKLIGEEPETIQVEFVENSGIPDLALLNISSVVRDSIIRAPSENEDRSSSSQRVITALLDAGCSDSQIRSVFMNYPIGTQSKYAEKGEHADQWLAHSIGNARAWLKTHRSSKAIPGKIITPREAMIEDRVLREVYKAGWHDALTSKMELLKLWPDYLGLDDEIMSSTMVNIYGLGLRTDYVLDDKEFPALAVPLADMNGDVTNVDYSIYGSSDTERAWESKDAPVFIADLEKIGADKLVIFDDWDIAAYVYLSMSHDLGDIAVASVNSVCNMTDMTIGQLSSLVKLARESKEVVLVWDMNEIEKARWLSKWLSPSETRWVRWPFHPRDMFKKRDKDGRAIMDSMRLRRALRGSEILN
jgi:hypothetical protein